MVVRVVVAALLGPEPSRSFAIAGATRPRLSPSRNILRPCIPSSRNWPTRPKGTMGQSGSDTRKGADTGQSERAWTRRSRSGARLKGHWEPQTEECTRRAGPTVGYARAGSGWLSCWTNLGPITEPRCRQSCHMGLSEAGLQRLIGWHPLKCRGVGASRR